jgi:hypothetical protein
VDAQSSHVIRMVFTVEDIDSRQFQRITNLP